MKMKMKMKKSIRLAQNKDDHHDLVSDDLLSRLSDDILVYVLSYMPLKDAAVTSNLSRRWKYLWCQIVRLDFEDKKRLITITMEPKLCFTERNKYINWVNRIIRQHKGPTIDEFRICFDLDMNANDAINKWIKFAISKNVQLLELDLSDEYHLRYFKRGRKYVFPNNIFDKKSGSSLKQQSLNVIDRPYASVMEMKFLKALVLKCVDVNDEGLGKILSNCPVLENLSVHGSSHLVKAKIHGKRLALKNFEIRFCDRLKIIEICDANIVWFNCLASSPITLRLDNLQKLEKISIGEGNPGYLNHLFFQISACCLPFLQVLELKLSHPRLLRFPELPKLRKVLMTVGVWDDASLFMLTSLVDVCLNLQRFTIQLIWMMQVKTNREVRQVTGQPHQHLEVVEIDGYCGHTCDLELAIFFLENCVALKKLVIDPSDPEMKRRLASNEVTERENGARYRARQQLEPKIPTGVELVIV